MTILTFMPVVLFLLWSPCSVYGGHGKDTPAPQSRIQGNDVPKPQAVVIRGEGIDMEAYLYFPKGDGPFPAIIALPGGRGSKGKVYPYHKEFGEIMAARGFAVLVLDYSNPNRRFLDTRRIQDIGAAVEFLKRQDRIQKHNIFLVGFSMGGSNALRVAGSRDDIAGLVCYFAPVDWRISKYPMTRKVKQPIDYCGDLSCPVLILHGDQDIATDVKQGRHLHDTLKSLGKSAKLVIYKGGAHGFTYRGVRDTRCGYNADIANRSFDEVEKFIKTHVKEVPAKTEKAAAE